MSMLVRHHIVDGCQQTDAAVKQVVWHSAGVNVPAS